MFAAGGAPRAARSACLGAIFAYAERHRMRPDNPVRGPGTQLGAHGKPLRSLNGGSEFEFTGVDICAGDTITAVSKVVSVTERKASLGMMVITRRETTYTNQNGEVVGRSYGTNLAY